MKTISLVIPVYNEERRVQKTLEALRSGFSFDGLTLEEVIFVNDGSTDMTVSKLKEQRLKIKNALKAKVSVISYTQNRGKGYAVRQGMKKSKADYTLLLDCDMSTPLAELKKFLPYIKSSAPVIIGTRKNGKSTVVKAQPLYRQVLGRGFTLTSNIALNTWVSDFTCGFKAFSKEAKEEIFTRARIDRWGYDAEILFLAEKLHLAIAESAVQWSDDKRTKVNLRKDVFGSLTELWEIRSNHLQNLYEIPKTSNAYSRKFSFAK